LLAYSKPSQPWNALIRQRSNEGGQDFHTPPKITDEINLVNLLDIWDINLDRVRRELRVEQESGAQIFADEFRADVPFREDLVCKVWSDLIFFKLQTTNQ
jgi:hypothetical protein